MRERLFSMKTKFEYTDPNRNKYPTKFMHRPATVTKIVGKVASIRFEGNLKSEDESFEVSIDHICRKQS